MKNIQIVLMVLSFCTAPSFGQNKTKIIGEWKSEALEPANGLYGLREFTISKDKWEVKFTLFSDKEGANPIFTFRGKGKYIIEKRSKIIKSANNATFYFERKYLTLKTANQDLIKNFGFSPLKVNQETDVAEDGLSFVESVKACGQEYDLVAIENDKLYLGMRPEQGKNICTVENRPTKLNTPLIRVN